MDKRKIKIAQIVCQLPPISGGIGMAAHSYADQLYERGYDVVVFMPKYRVDCAQDKRYKVIQLSPLLKVGYGAILPQLILKIFDFDIVHLHYPFFGCSLIVALLCRLRKDRIKLVINYHMDVNLSGWRKIYNLIFQRYFLKFILDSSDKIIVSSIDYIENSNIQGYYFRHLDKFVELPFGVPRVFRPEPKDELLLKKYNLKIQDKVVMFLGGLDKAHYFKGVSYLVKAFSFLPQENIKLLIVGGGDCEEKYKILVKSLKLSGRVIFTGYVEKDEIVSHYNLADIFILPSINSSEAFGIALIEAMACGKPVIASNLKGVRSVVDAGVNGLLVEPKNSRDIAEKIKYFINNPEVAKKFGESCMESVEKKYRWSVIVGKLDGFYSALLQKA